MSMERRKASKGSTAAFIWVGILLMLPLRLSGLALTVHEVECVYEFVQFEGDVVSGNFVAVDHDIFWGSDHPGVDLIGNCFQQPVLCWQLRNGWPFDSNEGNNGSSVARFLLHVVTLFTHQRENPVTNLSLRLLAVECISFVFIIQRKFQSLYLSTSMLAIFLASNIMPKMNILIL